MDETKILKCAMRSVQTKGWNLYQVLDYIKQCLPSLFLFLPVDLVLYILELSTGGPLSQLGFYQQMEAKPLYMTLLGKKLYSEYATKFTRLSTMKTQIRTLYTEISTVRQSLLLQYWSTADDASSINLKQFSVRVFEDDECKLVLHFDNVLDLPFYENLQSYIKNRVIHIPEFRMTFASYHKYIMAFKVRDDLRRIPFSTYLEDVIFLSEKDRRVIRYLDANAFFSHTIIYGCGLLDKRCITSPVI